MPILTFSRASYSAARSVSPERAAAIRLFAEGHGYKYVSAVLGINLYRVRDWNREWKAGVVRHGHRVGPKGESLVRMALEMRKNGASYTEIIAAVKVPKRTIMNWIRKKGHQAPVRPSLFE